MFSRRSIRDALVLPRRSVSLSSRGPRFYSFTRCAAPRRAATRDRSLVPCQEFRDGIANRFDRVRSRGRAFRSGFRSLVSLPLSLSLWVGRGTLGSSRCCAPIVETTRRKVYGNVVTMPRRASRSVGTMRGNSVEVAGLGNSETSGKVINYFNEFTGELLARWRLVDYPGLSNLRIYIKHEWPRPSRENSHEPPRLANREPRTSRGDRTELRGEKSGSLEGCGCFSCRPYFRSSSGCFPAGENFADERRGRTKRTAGESERKLERSRQKLQWSSDATFHRRIPDSLFPLGSIRLRARGNRHNRLPPRARERGGGGRAAVDGGRDEGEDRC